MEGTGEGGRRGVGTGRYSQRDKEREIWFIVVVVQDIVAERDVDKCVCVCACVCVCVCGVVSLAPLCPLTCNEFFTLQHNYVRCCFCFVKYKSMKKEGN